MPEISDAVQAAVDAVLAHPWRDAPNSAHAEHRYDAQCAVCRRDVAAVLAVAAPVIAEQTRAEAIQLRVQLAEVCAPHYEFRIYESCGHAVHEDDQDAVELDDGETVCRDGYRYSICGSCCTFNDSQTELCADEHDHAKCWPCPTARIAREAFPKEAPDTAARPSMASRSVPETS